VLIEVAFCFTVIQGFWGLHEITIESQTGAEWNEKAGRKVRQVVTLRRHQ
jgi:hypothetical protein